MLPEAKGAPTPLKAAEIATADKAGTPVTAPPAPSEPYAKKPANSTAETGAGDADAGNKPSDKPADPDVVPTKRGGQNE